MKFVGMFDRRILNKKMFEFFLHLISSYTFIFCTSIQKKYTNFCYFFCCWFFEAAK